MKDEVWGEDWGIINRERRGSAMGDDGTDEDLGEQLERQADDIRDFVEKNSSRPAVDVENVERLLEEASPAQASEELHKMADGFRSGAGAASGRNSLPASEDSPTDDLPRPDLPAEVPPDG